jgi:metal-responsive CopG/Arc/MetJ family transcriptional regulator
MKRTTISMPDDLANALEREMRRRGAPASAIVRDALLDYLKLRNPGSRRPVPIAGLGASGQRNIARDAEQILRAEWGGEPRDH